MKEEFEKLNKEQKHKVIIELLQTKSFIPSYCYDGRHCQYYCFKNCGIPDYLKNYYIKHIFEFYPYPILPSVSAYSSYLCQPKLDIEQNINIPVYFKDETQMLLYTQQREIDKLNFQLQLTTKKPIRHNCYICQLTQLRRKN